MIHQGLKDYSELAIFLGRTRARVVQVMSVLKAAPAVIAALQAANIKAIIVTERRWRFLRTLQNDTILKTLSTLKPGLY